MNELVHKYKRLINIWKNTICNNEEQIIRKHKCEKYGNQ